MSLRPRPRRRQERIVIQAVDDLARRISLLHPCEFSALLGSLRRQRKLTPERPPHQRDLIDVMDDIADVQAQIREIIYPPPSSLPHLQDREAG